jgi:glycosyltransferase involved in cell wall biosynthesis
VRLILWHGYLLEGTGSNIYTQHIARAWGRLGHDVVVVCQQLRAERFDLGPRVRVVRPDVGPLLPTFIVDRYEGIEARHVADLSAAELDRFTSANVDAIRAELASAPTDLVLANHAIMGGPVASAACDGDTPFAVKVHGSELEYAIRGRPALADLARESLNGAAAVYAGSQHIVSVTQELLGEGRYRDAIRIVPPGVDTDGFAPGRGSLEELRRLLDAGEGTGWAEPAERTADPGAAEALAGVGRFVLYFGKLMRQKGVHLLLEAWHEVGPRHPDVGLVVVGFGDARAELEAAAPPGTVFTGAMDHEQLQLLVPLAEAVVVPSVLPEAFGMVAAEAAACEVLPIVSDHSGLAEVAAGLGEAGITFDGSSADLARRLDALLDLPPGERARLGAVARAAVVERWSWEGIARRLIDDALGSGRSSRSPRPPISRS